LCRFFVFVADRLAETGRKSDQHQQFKKRRLCVQKSHTILPRLNKKSMPNCKQCQTSLDRHNCGYTGMHNFATGDRYMDNVCRECKKHQCRVRRRLLEGVPRPPEGTPCACCGRVKKLHLDHDHATDMFRGFICQSCNHGLGHLGDNLQGVRNALAYLESTGLYNQ